MGQMLSIRPDKIMILIHDAATRIDSDRDFRVHSNGVTEDAIRAILTLSEDEISLIRGSRVMSAAYDAVDEYHRAKAKHGDNTPDGDTTDTNRLATIMEEVGEVARCLTYDQDHAGNLRKELIQVAAMALAWASRLNREAANTSPT